MNKEFDSRLISGNNALKAEVWQTPQPKVLAPIINIDTYRTGCQETSQDTKELQDLLEIDRLEDQWNKELGITKEEGFYNYHPVLARWRFEEYQKTGKEIQRFRLTEDQNITTALRERDHTRESRLKFVIEEDKIRAEFSDEPHEATIVRGLNYRIAHGSKEQDREKAEVRGFKDTQTVLTSEETPVGTKLGVISGRGLKKNTQYPDNFVDFYELKEDESKKRYISYTRFSSASGYDHYKKVVEALSPNFFDGYEGSIDAWFLSHPILISPSPEDVDQIFDKYFDRDPKAMVEEQFLERLEMYRLFEQNYLNEVTALNFNPIRIAKSWNLMLLSPDNKLMRVWDLKDIPRIVSEYGWMQPAKVMAGCGMSAGFKIGGDQTEDYTGENAKKDPRLCRCGGQEPHFHCDGTIEGKTCGHAIEVGKGISKCPICGEGKKC